MSAVRYTVDTLKSGQTRPYGPTIERVRFTIERSSEGGWVPFDIAEERVREKLLALKCGFTEFIYPPKDRKPTEGDYFATRLEWLERVSPGVWEFETYANFCD